jgi:hypothetical protein
MNYNLYIKTNKKEFNILDITEVELQKVIDSYNVGKEDFFIQGTKYFFVNLLEIQIFTFENDKISSNKELMQYCYRNNLVLSAHLNLYSWIPTRNLEYFGKRVTEDFIKGDFGYLKNNPSVSVKTDFFVDNSRISEIIQISSSSFDFTKLIQILRELNLAYANSMYLTIPLLIRATIDHIPPVFDKVNFADVCGSYGTRSFKESMNNLEKSSRKIADSFLHTPIRNKETLPTEVQVNFKNDLDVLLQEIVRKMKP